MTRWSFNSIAFLTFFCVSFSSFSQYSPISGRELESYRYQNHQSNNSGDQGLYTQMIIEVEDFDLLQQHFVDLKAEFLEVFTPEVFELNSENKRLIVVFDKTLTKTDDFLKIFKETMYTKGVLLYLYNESILLKS